MAYQDKNSRWRTGSEVKLLLLTNVRFHFDIYTLSGSLISRWDQTCELQDIFWSCSTWQQKGHLNQSTDSLHQVFTLVTALWSGRCTWMEKTNCIEVQPDRSQSESMFKQSYTQHVIFDLSVLRLYTVFFFTEHILHLAIKEKFQHDCIFMLFFFLCFSCRPSKASSAPTTLTMLRTQKHFVSPPQTENVWAQCAHSD